MQELNLSGEELFKASLCMLIAMADADARLVERYNVPKFLVFKAVASTQFSEALVNMHVGDLEEKRKRCAKCVDRVFTPLWIRRLRDPHRKRRAHRVLRRMVARLPLQSGRVERLHLVGQSLKTVRSRGRAPSAAELGKQTYAAVTQHIHTKKAETAIDSSLGPPGHKLRHQFSLCLVRHQLGPNGRRGKAGRKRLASTYQCQSIKVRGYDIFRSKHLSSHGFPTAEQVVQCNEAWQRLPLCRKLLYHAEAASKRRRLDELGKLSFPEFCEAEQALGDFTSKQIAICRQCCVKNTLGEMTDNTAWRSCGEVDGGNYRIANIMSYVQPSTCMYYNLFKLMCKRLVLHCTCGFRSCR